MSIFTTRPRPAARGVHQKRLLRIPSVRQRWHAYVCNTWSKYTMWFKSYMSIFTNWPRPAARGVHQKGCYASQWLDNDGMHTYAHFDQNIPVMSIFTNWLWTDRQTNTFNIVHNCGWCNLSNQLRKRDKCYSVTVTYNRHHCLREVIGSLCILDFTRYLGSNRTEQNRSVSFIAMKTV